MVWAECDEVAAAAAGDDAGRVVVGVGVSSWAGALEDAGVGRRPARLRVAEAPRAAVPGRVEGEASALARHHPVRVVLHLQPDGAHPVQIAHAPRIAALAGPSERRDRDGEVVPVHEAHVLEVLLAEGDLGEGRRRCASHAVAVEGTAAVTGGAVAPAGGVEDAVLAAPDAAGPAGGDLEGVSLVGEEAEAAAG